MNITEPPLQETVKNKTTNLQCHYSMDELLEEWAGLDDVTNIITHIICCVALVLNCLAIAAYHYIHGPQARFLQNLAVADGLLPIVFILQEWLPPFAIIDRCHELYGCAYFIYSVIGLYVAAMSLVGLVGLVTNHVLAILYPFRYYSMLTTKKVVLVLVLSWVLPLLCVLASAIHAMILYNDTNNTEPVEPYCEIIGSDEVTFVGKVMWIVLSVLVILTIAGMYFKVYIVAKKSMYWSGRVSTQSQSMRNNLKALKTTVFLLLSLILSWCLIVICMVALTYGLDSDMHSLMIGLFHIWLIVNSISDPVIILLRMTQMRAAYRTLFRCCLATDARHQKSPSITTSSLRETEMQEIHNHERKRSGQVEQMNKNASVA